jgi:hypothetical protein
MVGTIRAPQPDNLLQDNPLLQVSPRGDMTVPRLRLQRFGLNCNVSSFDTNPSIVPSRWTTT